MERKEAITYVCKNCEKEITEIAGNGRRKIYCSYDCQRESIKKRQQENNLSRQLKLRTGETGTINEMLVAIDLIKNGYKVFMPFDTITGRDDISYRVN